jgi:hypothetical protein
MTGRQHASTTIVGPRDCAIGIAVPLTIDEFVDDFRDERKDFVQHVRFANTLEGASDDYYWSTVYAPVAAIVNDALAAVKSLGVCVRRRVTPAELGQLLGQYKVVTVVTHWRFGRLSAADILDPRALHSAIANPADPLQARAAGAIKDASPRLIQDVSADIDDDTLRRQIADAIAPVISAAHASYRTPAEHNDDVVVVGQPRVIDLRRVTRLLIEEAFAPHVRPAPAIEFGNGLVTAEDLIEVIPRSFDGILDLTSCNSVIIGAAVKRKRPDCLVAINRYRTELYVRMTLYRLAIASLARSNRPYMDVLTNQRK